MASHQQQEVNGRSAGSHRRASQALWAALSQLLRAVPAVRPWFWRQFYNHTAARMADQGCTFMNWGYLEDGGHSGQASEDRSDLMERLSTALYDRALAGIDIDGRAIVEVGSGRGGGCAHIASAHSPASVTGIDASDLLVAWCRSTHQYPNLRYEHGFASQLPFASGSVDVVVCIESSHCYPSRLEFFREVVRVLTPGGKFALADFLWPNKGIHDSADIERLLDQAGLTLEHSELITPQVLAARSALSRSPAFQRRLPLLQGGFLRGKSAIDAWALEGTPYFSEMTGGELEYWTWKSRKAADVRDPV